MCKVTTYTLKSDQLTTYPFCFELMLCFRFCGCVFGLAGVFSGLLLCFGFINVFLHLPATVSNGRKIIHLEMYSN